MGAFRKSDDLVAWCGVALSCCKGYGWTKVVKRRIFWSVMLCSLSSIGFPFQPSSLSLSLSLPLTLSLSLLPCVLHPEARKEVQRAREDLITGRKSVANQG